MAHSGLNFVHMSCHLLSALRIKHATKASKKSVLMKGQCIKGKEKYEESPAWATTHEGENFANTGHRLCSTLCIEHAIEA